MIFSHCQSLDLLVLSSLLNIIVDNPENSVNFTMWLMWITSEEGCKTFIPAHTYVVSISRLISFPH